MKIEIIMREKLPWMEIIGLPEVMIKEQLHDWIRMTLQPHAIRYPWGIWDQVNGWRTAGMDSTDVEYWCPKPKSWYDTVSLTYLRQVQRAMNDKLRAERQFLSGDQWTDQQNIADRLQQKQHDAQMQHLLNTRIAMSGSIGAFSGMPVYSNPFMRPGEAVIMDLGKQSARFVWGSGV